MEKKELPRLSLLQIRSVLDEIDEQNMHAYVNRNVGVVKRLMPYFLRGFVKHPFMLEEMRVMVVTRGSVRLVVNLLPVEINVGDLIFLSKNSIVELQSISSDIEGEGFAMSDEIFRIAMGEMLPTSLDGHLRYFKIILKQNELVFVNQFIDMLYKTLKNTVYGLPTFLSLGSAFWWYVDSLYKHGQQSDSNIQTCNQQLFSRFVALVNEHAQREHNLEFYANRLCMSPRYMSTIIKKESGRSAKEWIDEALVTAIKVDLRHSSKPLKQIANEANFPNTSFFSKFFKRMTSKTPLAYRNEQPDTDCT